jgi:hypothetical protein
MALRTAEPAEEGAHECVVRAEGDVRSPLLRDLWAYWRSRHVGAKPPGRKDIDPAAIPQLLPYVMLLDVLDGSKAEPPDFRFRLVGTHIALIHRTDNTGKRVTEAFHGDERATVLRLYRRTVEECAPVAYRGQPLRRDGRVLDYEIVHLPLVDARDRVNVILAGLEFTLRP